MTTKYPNKTILVYASFLNTNPKTCVGGVEIGNQFYNVSINHPIAKDEPLVRSMPGYSNTGDARA
jgi:hypothetical protein